MMSTLGQFQKQFGYEGKTQKVLTNRIIFSLLLLAFFFFTRLASAN